MDIRRERSISCQKNGTSKRSGTRIPLPVTTPRRPLVDIIKTSKLRRTLILNELQNFQAGAAPFTNITETLSPKDDDLDSLSSYGSACTSMSCDHAHFARNGTTFSGRRKKYVVHCSSYSGETEQYLTPTQRANKQIQILQMLLSETRKELQKKNEEIFHLMKELVELRLYKASLTDVEEVPGSSEDLKRIQNTEADADDALGKGETSKVICADSESYIENSQDSASRQENVPNSPSVLLIEKIAVDLPSSPTDSGNFEETASSSSILLSEAKKDLEKKDQDDLNLKTAVMEVHPYYKATLSNEDIALSSEIVIGAQDTDADQKYSLIKDETDQGICAKSESCEDLQDSALRQGNVQNSPGLLHSGKTAADLPSSLTDSDSGNFEETALSSSINPKESTSSTTVKDHASDVLEHGEDVRGHNCMLEKNVDELERRCANQLQEHNDKMQKLLQNLSDANDRCYELHSDYEKAQDKIRELEKDNESLRKSLEEQEEKHKSMYLKMYTKGQEAARFEHADQVLEFAHRAPSRVSVPELVQELQSTKNELENLKESDEHESDYSETALLTAKDAISLWILGTRQLMNRKLLETRAGKSESDPVIILQFLKSAIYHFLTAKENYQGHLNAIENILEYSETERLNIEKAYRFHAKK